MPVRSMFWKSGPKWAIRRGEWKLVKDGRAEPFLFHLAVDMSEKNDLSGKRAGRAEELRKLWLEWDKKNVPASFGWNKALGNEVEHAER